MPREETASELLEGNRETGQDSGNTPQWPLLENRVRTRERGVSGSGRSVLAGRGKECGVRGCADGTGVGRLSSRLVLTLGQDSRFRFRFCWPRGGAEDPGVRRGDARFHTAHLQGGLGVPARETVHQPFQPFSPAFPDFGA